MEFWKLNLKEIGILEIKFERNWNFENYLRIGVLKLNLRIIKVWKVKVLKIKIKIGALKI